MYKKEGSLRNCRNVTWNEHGTGLMFEDLNIPIVKIHTASDIDFMKEVSLGFLVSGRVLFRRPCAVF